MTHKGDHAAGALFGADTSPEAERIMLDGFRRMSGTEKLRRVSALSRLVSSIALADLRLRHPESDERELLLRLAARRMDPAILERLVGWSPGTEVD